MDNEEHITRRLQMFGDFIEIEVFDTEDVVALPIIESAYSYGLELQKIFNLYDPKSELSLLNSKRNIKASQHLLNIIKLALLYCEKTKGVYDIALGKQFLARKAGKEIKVDCSYKDILIDGTFISLLHNDVIIDLGSVAKGYIAQKMADFIKSEGLASFIVDARGDMSCNGRDELISIQHPRKMSEIFSTIKIKDKAVATSGDYYQFWENYEKSHIINKTDIISATVIADDLAVADLFATILMVSKSSELDKLLSDRKDIQAMLIDNSLDVKYYNGFESLIVK